MKKILTGILFLSVGLSTAIACDNNKHNTIKYTTQAQTSIKSQSILVEVVGYATTSIDKQSLVKQQIIANVNSIVKSDWKVNNLNISKNKSGSVNLAVYMQSRITPKQLNDLQNTIDKKSHDNQKLEVNVLDYNPPLAEINKAKQKLMIDLYKESDSYVQEFNKETNSDYHIQSIDFISSDYSPQNNNMVLMRTTANNNSNDSNSLISKDIKISVNVTFSTKQDD